MVKRIGLFSGHKFDMKSLLIVALALFSGGVWGQTARISLLTCSPGEAMYSMFGHSAVRVQDPARGIDMVYNYGTFDFQTPNFVWKFMRGKLLYQLDVQSFRQFMREYKAEGRSVYEEELRLEEGDQRALEAFLADNYRPENRYYLYDFFFDNCSSRIRDAIETVFGSRLTYQFPEGSQPMTYRSAIDPYIHSRPWLDFGIDLLLGMPTDRLADERGQMFLPDHLSGQLAYARVDGDKKLLGPRVSVLEYPAPENGNGQPGPSWIFWTLLPGFVLLWRFSPPFIRKADAAFWILYGLAGSLVAFMWWGTDHQATQQNWNLLWLNPFELLVGVAIAFGSRSGWLRVFGWIQLGCAAIVLAGWVWLPQALPLPALPLVFLLGFQSLRLSGIIKFSGKGAKTGYSS